MQKVIDILEQYVEWVALAIGALFLLLMVAFYLVGTPVKGTIGTRVVTPANVEQQVYDQAGRPLEEAMRDKAAPDPKVPAYAETFAQRMQLSDSGVKAAVPGIFVVGGAPVSPIKSVPGTSTGEKVEAAIDLPQLPTPSWFGSSSGKSNVKVDLAAAGGGMPIPSYTNPNPEATYGGPMPTPAARTSRTRGGEPVATTEQPPAPGGEDKVWVTEAFTISAQELADAFAKAKVPAATGTIFLRLDVQRQELLPDGKWGNETSVEPMRFLQVPEYPKVGSLNEERTYADWAGRNQQTLLAPAFYPQVAGDRWWAPGQPNPNQAAEVRPVVQPPQPPTGVRGRRINPNSPAEPTPGRRFQVRDAGRPDSGNPGGGMPREAYEALRRAGGTVEPTMPPSSAYGPQGPYGQGTYGDAAYGPTGPGTPGVGVTQGIPEGFIVPNGTFFPSELQGDIFVWTHDDTVSPGKTYRYRMAYRLLNPVFGKTQSAPTEAAAKQLAITSPFSEWGTPLQVGDIVRFFVAAGPSVGAGAVKFDVFRWQEGTWRLKQFNAAIGDAIGGTDGRFDYATGWSLADVNAGSTVLKDPIVLANAQGRLDTRNFASDQAAAGKFKREIAYREPGAAPTGPGMTGPGGPGMTPPPGYDPSMGGMGEPPTPRPGRRLR